MSHSFARPLKITCLECGKTFSADVYMIVDVAERPDLLELIRNETLHQIPCSHCGHRGPADVPLLVFRPNQEPHLLFALAAGMGVEWNQEQARELVGRLKKSLGRGWRDEWVRNNLQSIQNRSMLPAALSDDPQAAMQETAKQQARDAERMKAENPGRYYDVLLNAFVGAQAESRKRQIVESYPDLLSEEARTRLNDRMAMALKDRNMEASALYSQNLLLLDMWAGEFKHA